MQAATNSADVSAENNDVETPEQEQAADGPGSEQEPEPVYSAFTMRMLVDGCTPLPAIFWNEEVIKGTP